MRNHPRHAWFAALAIPLLVAPSCADAPAPAATGPGVAISVAPLSLSSVVNADYRITVRTSTDTVFTVEVDSTTYGDGAGAITYIGPCDADAGLNTVELELLALYDADGPIPADTYVNPTAAGPLTQDVLCVENADRPVVFNLTIMRDAQQGFFDIAVNFEDLFCSAKVDCQADGEDILLVHHPVSGKRLPSAVIGLACTGGVGADTHLYFTDMVIQCGDLMLPIPLGDGPGNLYDAIGPAPIAQAMTFTGEEQLEDPTGASLGKIYFNLAFGIDFDALDPAAYAAGCTLSFRTSASDGPLDGCTTPDDTTYPVLAVDALPFIAADAAGFACTTHPVGSAAFPATYTPFDTPQAFSTEIDFDEPTSQITVTDCEPTFEPDHVTIDAIVYEDLDLDGVVDPGEAIPGATVTLVPDTAPGANLLHVLPPWQGTSDANGHVIVDHVPVMTPLCLTLSSTSHADTTQCGLTLTEPVGSVITTTFALRSSCVAVDTDDDTCNAIDDDCDGIIDEDADPLACDPCLAATDCCSGVCTAGVCTGAPLPYVVASLTIDGPADLPSDYECITEVTAGLDISPDPINGPLPAMNWASLQLVGGALFVPTSSWDVAHFPVLTTVTNAVQFYGTGEDSIISVPALTTIGGTMDIYGDDLTLNFSSLTSVGTILQADTLTNTGDNLQIAFPALVNMGADIFLYNATATSSLAFPALETVAGGVYLSPFLDPAALDFDQLTSIALDLQIATGGSSSPYGQTWTSLSTFATLQSVGTLRVRGNENLTSLGLTSLTAVTDVFDIDYNINLSNCDALALYQSLTTTPPTGYSGATGNDTVGGTCPNWSF